MPCPGRYTFLLVQTSSAIQRRRMGWPRGREVYTLQATAICLVHILVHSFVIVTLCTGYVMPSSVVSGYRYADDEKMEASRE